MKHFPLIAKLAYLIAHLLCLCGCGASADAAIPSDDRMISAELGLADHDLKSYQPALPDDFKKPSPGLTNPDTTGRAPQQQPLPVVLADKQVLFTAYSLGKTCTPCVKMKADAIEVEKATHGAVKFTVIEDEAAFPQWVRDLLKKNEKLPDDKKRGYPFVEWTNATGWWFSSGWTNLKDFMGKWSGTLKSVDPKSVAGGTAKSLSSASDAPAAVLLYRGQSSSWTWPGNLRSHLVNEHGYSWQQVQGMSDAAVIRAHDAAHNGTTMRAQAPRRVRSRNCPNGVCPL